MYYIWKEVDPNTLIYMGRTDLYKIANAKIVDNLMRDFTYIRFAYDYIDSKNNITQLCYISYTKYGMVNGFHRFVVEYIPVD